MSNQEIPRFDGDFWNQTERLQNIHDYAADNIASPDALLQATLARLSAFTNQKVDTGVGSPNTAASYYALLIGPSGAGKSMTMSAAERYLDINQEQSLIKSISAGTSQGLVNSYLKYETDPDTKQRDKVRAYDGVLVTVDEGAKLVPNPKDSNHIAPTLIEMWAGTSDPGQANASMETSRSLEGGTYQIGLVAGIQNKFAVDLIRGSSEQGLPQRCGWADMAVPGAFDLANSVRGVTPLPFNQDMLFRNSPVGRPIEFKHEIKELIRLDRLKSIDSNFDLSETIGGGNPLNRHKVLLMSKVALLLAVLDAHDEVRMEHWNLAEQIVDQSFAIRDHFMELVKAEEVRERTDNIKVRRAERAFLDGKTETLDPELAAFDEHLHLLRRHAEGPLRAQCPKGGHSFACAWRSLAAPKRKKFNHQKKDLEKAFNEALNQATPLADGVDPCKPRDIDTDDPAAFELEADRIVLERQIAGIKPEWTEEEEAAIQAEVERLLAADDLAAKQANQLAYYESKRRGLPPTAAMIMAMDFSQ